MVVVLQKTPGSELLLVISGQAVNCKVVGKIVRTDNFGVTKPLKMSK